MALIFSKDPVWSQTTKSGFQQQIFVMYHATARENVSNILQEGFKNSQGSTLTLGSGLYVSRDKDKAESYGEVCFKLLVYPGKTYGVWDPEDPLRFKWNRDHSSAWIPSYSNFPHSDREETCVKSASQVAILGVSKGWDRLHPYEKLSLRDRTGTGDSLDQIENAILDDLIEKLCIAYCNIVSLDTTLMLESYHGRLKLTEWNGTDDQLWTRTWDNCLENKATGLVITLDQSDMLTLEPVDVSGNKAQKWKLDKQRRLLSKFSNKVLTVIEDQVKLRRFMGRDSDRWNFRCMDNTRKCDDFVQYTPWQNMITW